MTFFHPSEGVTPMSAKGIFVTFGIALVAAVVYDKKLKSRI